MEEVAECCLTELLVDARMQNQGMPDFVDRFTKHRERSVRTGVDIQTDVPTEFVDGGVELAFSNHAFFLQPLTNR